MYYSRTRAFRFSVDRVGIFRESYPQPVQRAVDQTDNQTVNDVADQGSEQRCASLVGPVQNVPLPFGKDREGPEEPPQYAVGRAPTHARSVATHISLKQDTEGSADNYRENEMQCDAYHHRFRMDQSRNQGKEMNLGHPFAKRPAADNPGDTANHYRARKAESRQLLLRPKPGVQGARSSNRQPEWRSKAQNVVYEFWIMTPSRIEHPHRRRLPHGERHDACR